MYVKNANVPIAFIRKEIVSILVLLDVCKELLLVPTFQVQNLVSILVLLDVCKEHLLK